MATPTIREVVHTSSSGVAATVTTGIGTAVDDVLICFAGSDFYDAATFGAPTGTAGTWTQIATTADLGTNNSHMKVWWRKVTAGGAQTVTVSPHPDEDLFNTVYVLTGADTTNPIDDAQSAATDPGASASHVCPAVSPTTADALCLTGIYTQVFSLTNYTAPAGFTKQNEDDNSSTGATASKVLSSSGSTGTLTWTADIISCKFVTCTVAVKGAGAAAADTSAPPQAVPPHLLYQLALWWQSRAEITSQTYTQSFDGTITSSGVVTKQAQKPLAGTITSSGALTKQANKALAGSVASSGALAKLVGKSLAGTIASSGALTTVKVILKSFAGTITSAGVLTKQVGKPLAGAITSAGALTKQVGKTLAGTITSSATLALIKVILRAFAGTITSSGALTRQTQKPLSGNIAPSGSVTKRIARALAGSVASSGALAKQAGKALAGTITSSAVISRLVGKLLGGSVTPHGTVSTSGGSQTANATSTSTVGTAYSSISTVAGKTSSTPTVAGKTTSTPTVSDG